MKKYSGFSAKTVLLIASVTVLVSCNDSWKEHYSYKTDSSYPVDKIDVTLEGIEGYENFYAALENTYLYDKDGNRYKDNQTFLDLLNQDQFITVWAPSNESVSKDQWKIYMDPNKSDSLNYEVGEKFLKMHIARFKHTVGDVDTSKVFMLNGKPVVSTPAAMGGQPYHGTDKNIRCLNGVLHCLDGNIKFLPNIYEYITTSPDYRDILGDWYKSYTKEEVDQANSIASGIDENGEKIWIDAVIIESSILMREYGFINSEDSTYNFLLPERNLWIEQYNRIKDYFVYNESKTNNDSLQKFYTYCAMMTDMCFNMNGKIQRHYPDSVFSTPYNSSENRREKKPYHVFAYPEDAVNGVFGSAQQEIECSNGKIFIINKWPFADTLTFLRDIKLEAEDYRDLPSLFAVAQRSVNKIGRDTLKQAVRVMRILSAGGENYWDNGARFYIKDNLKGKYSIKVIVSPNTEEDNKPCLFHPIVLYAGEKLYDSTITYWDTVAGMAIPITEEYLLSGSSTKIDTLEIAVVDIPYSAYDMKSSPLAVELYSRVNTSSTETYSGEIWLDGIVLEPVVE